MANPVEIVSGTEGRTDRVRPDQLNEAHYASLHAAEQALAANRDHGVPKVVLFDRDGVTAVYVSTMGRLHPAVRADVKGAVRAALAPYTRSAPCTQVVFLTRGRP